MNIEFIEIDVNGYRICDAPNASGDEPNIAPHIAADLTTPDGMRKARYLNGSWIDEEAAQLAADLAAQKLDDIENAIDALILSKAKGKYNSVVSCITYLNSSNPQWRAEAQAFLSYRDAVWLYVIGELAKVELGTRTLPTPEDAVAEIELLYPMVWP